MKAGAYYWLHMLPLLIALGLGAALLVLSVLFSLWPRRRATWLPMLLTGLFGALIFVSPPFRFAAHDIVVGQLRWRRLTDNAGAVLVDHLRLDSLTVSWLPEFLVGFLLFAAARWIFERLRR